MEDNWNCKIELLKYLKSDVEGLFEVITKMSVSIFYRFQINMTKFKSFPSMAMGIFTYNFYDEDHQIIFIKGNLEKDIRSAYFGGIVESYNINIVKNACMYDMNSQYSSAMLNDMPVGNLLFILAGT
jgi:DNA polymerase family B